MVVGVLFSHEDCIRCGLDLLAEIAVYVAHHQTALARLRIAQHCYLYPGQHL